MYILGKKIIFKYRSYEKHYKTLKIVKCSDTEFIYYDTVVLVEDEEEPEKLRIYTVNKIDWNFVNPVCTVYLENHQDNYIVLKSEKLAVIKK